MKDRLGLTLSGAGETAAAHYERGVSELQRFVGDPVGSADKAIADAPDFVMAHVLKGWLYGLSTEREAMAVAGQCRARGDGARKGACRRTRASRWRALARGRAYPR